MNIAKFISVPATVSTQKDKKGIVRKVRCLITSVSHTCEFSIIQMASHNLYRLILIAPLTLLMLASSCKKKKENLSACKQVALQGRLVYESNTGAYTFKTNGGGHIRIVSSHHVEITHENYSKFKIEMWGDTMINGQKKTSANHENLNGKHIKDRIGARRTFIFPDGAKITMIADGEQGPLIAVSIYDGAESHRISFSCNTVEHSSIVPNEAQAQDNAEADGEAGGIEFIVTGLVFFNLYTEQTAGNKLQNRYPLGEIFRDNPNKVNDHYDDPRIGHT